MAFHGFRAGCSGAELERLRENVMWSVRDSSSTYRPTARNATSGSA